MAGVPTLPRLFRQQLPDDPSHQLSGYVRHSNSGTDAMNIATIAEPPPRCRWPILKQLAPDTGGRAIMMDRPVCVVGARSRVHLPLRSSLVSRAHALVVNDA